MAGTNYFTETINADGNKEYIALTDRSGLPVLVRGTVVPTSGNYSKGCIFTKTDASNGTKSVYENAGLTTSPSFKQISLDYEIKTVTVLAAATSGVATVTAGDVILGYYPTSNQDQFVSSIAISVNTLTITLGAAATGK